MRDLAGEVKIREFMRLLGRAVKSDVQVYFTGGATAVLFGWREATVDIDLGFWPEMDEIFRAIPDLKERLQINIELALPPDFIPLLPGWEDRCRFIAREGTVSFFHYDPYSQALSKIERGHDRDNEDVEAMLNLGLIEREKLASSFQDIRPNLYKYPAIDQKDFAEAVQRIVESKI